MKLNGEYLRGVRYLVASETGSYGIVWRSVYEFIFRQSRIYFTCSVERTIIDNIQNYQFKQNTYVPYDYYQR